MVVRAVEAASVAVIGLSVAIRFRRGRRAGLALLKDLAWIAPAAFLAEDSSIRLYGFYEYAQAWDLFVDRVPLFVVLIWPFVIVSARDLWASVAPLAPRWQAAWIVWTDASLIECVSTTAGLWRWTEPGPFQVPLIGPWGWACFAAAVLFAMDRLRGLRAVLAALALTHALLLASWWGLFRWVGAPVSDREFTAIAWLIGIVLAVQVHRSRVRAPRDEILARFAAALVFFGLVFLHRDRAALVALAGAFLPPWLTFTAKARPRRAAAG